MLAAWGKGKFLPLFNRLINSIGTMGTLAGEQDKGTQKTFVGTPAMQLIDSVKPSPRNKYDHFSNIGKRTGA